VLQLLVTANIPSPVILPTMKMEVTSSSETSVLTRATWHLIPEDSIFQISWKLEWQEHKLYTVYSTALFDLFHSNGIGRQTVAVMRDTQTQPANGNFCGTQRNAVKTMRITQPFITWDTQTKGPKLGTRYNTRHEAGNKIISSLLWFDNSEQNTYFYEEWCLLGCYAMWLL
jgi:predicted RecB family nuclease